MRWSNFSNETRMFFLGCFYCYASYLLFYNGIFNCFVGQLRDRKRACRIVSAFLDSLHHLWWDCLVCLVIYATSRHSFSCGRWCHWPESRRRRLGVSQRLKTSRVCYCLRWIFRYAKDIILTIVIAQSASLLHRYCWWILIAVRANNDASIRSFSETIDRSVSFAFRFLRMRFTNSVNSTSSHPMLNYEQEATVRRMNQRMVKKEREKLFVLPDIRKIKSKRKRILASFLFSLLCSII